MTLLRGWRLSASAALLAALAACSSGSALPDEDLDTAPSGQVQGLPVDRFYAASCASCHGLDREGGIGPSLTIEALTEPDQRYIATIRDGRAGSSMPAWGAAGLSDAEIRTLVAYLRTGEAPDLTTPSGDGASAELDVRAELQQELAAIEAGSVALFGWEIENAGEHPLQLTQLRPTTLSLFALDALPIRIEAGERVSVRMVLVPAAEGAAVAIASGVATAVVEEIDGGAREELRLVANAPIVAPAERLAFGDVPLSGFPARMTTWHEYVYVGYLDGVIEVFRFAEGSALVLVERVTAIAETPNHGPDGAPNLEQGGRWIGGMAVGADGTLYVSHADPRLNEGEFLETGHLADLNSGTLTALRSRPGGYGAPSSRVDLVRGLPRNVTNHAPLGMAIRDGWLYVAAGAMTDSGVPDESKPQPDTELSGAVLRLRVDAPASSFPLVLTEPGPRFATADDLEDGLLEIYATGVRNGFGLTVGPDGALWLTDQGSDGGAAPDPLLSGGPPGISPNLAPDHLHRIEQGAYLGQPNIAREQFVLNDGSAYEWPVASPGYSPPAHVFGVHNSATGLAFYEGEAFPDLDGWLLVGKFSGAMGVQALRLEDDRVAEVRSLTGVPETRNVTDVAIGPDGQIVIAEFWERRLRISTSYAP